MPDILWFPHFVISNVIPGMAEKGSSDHRPELCLIGGRFRWVPRWGWGDALIPRRTSASAVLDNTDGSNMTIGQYALKNGGPAPAVDLAEAIAVLSKQLADAGAAAVFVVRLPLLSEIERCYGPIAFNKVSVALSDAVQRYAEERFHSGEYLVAGDPRGEELILIMIRSRTNSAFYSADLPKISQSLMQYLEGQRSRIVYPYGPERADFSVGYGVAVHNPSLRADRRLLLALDSARADAELSVRIRNREIGRQFLGVVLDEQIRNVYQPIVNIQNNMVIGYEALARGPVGTEWQAP
ncbi:MAG TPA: hypothetical protein VE398_26030, partial [Acidobacteriota bacterium]|nr:hypothetical protein [Acidobacteriota bacterium]